MAKKNIHQKRVDREKQDNKTLQRVLNLFLVGLVAECYLFLVYRGYFVGSIDSLLIWDSILRWGIPVGIGAATASIVVGACNWKKNRKLSMRMLWPMGIGLFLAVSGWFTTRFFDNAQGVIAMCVAVPIITLLGLVFFLFQRECFLSTICLAGATLTAWLCGAGLQSSLAPAIKVGSVLAVVILAVLAVATVKVRKDEGKLGSFTLFTSDCHYPMLFAAYAISAVGVLAALLAPTMSYYLLWALGICIFGEMVYFTTKLM